MEWKHKEESQRANAYKLLSILYFQPTEEVGELLQYIKDDLKELIPELIPVVEEMETEFQLTREDITDLRVDHAKLFIGPFDVLAPPYSSIYIDGERKVMGDSTIKAYEHYKDSGLEMEPNFKDAPDHIAVELEFMYYLIFQYLKTEDSKFIEQQRSFLNSHLGEWIYPFTERVIDRANTTFYKNLGLMTRRFIEQELQQEAI